MAHAYSICKPGNSGAPKSNLVDSSNIAKNNRTDRAEARQLASTSWVEFKHTPSAKDMTWKPFRAMFARRRSWPYTQASKQRTLSGINRIGMSLRDSRGLARQRTHRKRMPRRRPNQRSKERSQTTFLPITTNSP